MKTSVFLTAAVCAALSFNLSAMAQSVTTIERDGLLMHVFVSKPVIFQVTSVVLEGANEVALIDAQFSADNAREVVDLIRSTGKPLKTIFISYSDPDYYFGLDLIAHEFPEAKVLATPQTVWLINATKDDKMAIWAPQLGSLNGPHRIMVPDALSENYFMLENRRIEVMCLPGDCHKNGWLWIPSARTILGGSCLSDGEHLWVADSPTREERTAWLSALTAMEKLKPEYTIPAHYIPGRSNLYGTEAIKFTRNYLTVLENALLGSVTAAEVIEKMRSAFPDLPGESSLDMTAKVLKGEMPWKVVRAFPAIGRKAEVNFGGEYVFELDFPNERTMSFRGLRERKEGRLIADTVKYTAVEIARQVYMVYWTEKNKTHVVHVEDFGQGVIYTNIAAPDGTFTNLKGTLRLLPVALPTEYRNGTNGTNVRTRRNVNVQVAETKSVVDDQNTESVIGTKIMLGTTTAPAIIPDAVVPQK